jgi:hypothetical protein
MTTLAPLARLFSELTEGAALGGEAFILNSGDAGLMRSLDKLSAVDASHSANGGATIAAHAQHVRYGLWLMNRWARERGNPFADAKWDEAWKTNSVSDAEWSEIRSGLAGEIQQWRAVLQSPPENLIEPETLGIYASVGHLAYHLGAMRQISKAMRGPREGTFR